MPANDNIFKVDSNSEKLSGKQAHDYASHVMRQQYLAKHQRYDLIFTISVLNKRMNNPSKKDWDDLTRLMKHLKSTREQKLILRSGKLDTVTAYKDVAFGIHVDIINTKAREVRHIYGLYRCSIWSTC